MNETRPLPRPPEAAVKSPKGQQRQQEQIDSLSSAVYKPSVISPFSKPTPIHSNTSMDRRSEYIMRGRADSVESTRGALFGTSSAVKKISPKKKPSRRKDDDTTIHQNPTTKTPIHRSHVRIGNPPNDMSSPLTSDLPILVIPSKESLIHSSHHHIEKEYPINDEGYMEKENYLSPEYVQTHKPDADNSIETNESHHDHTRKLNGYSPREKPHHGTWKEWIVNTVYTIFWDPYNDPEFSTVQQNTWAILLGIFMGVFTAKWGDVIESCVYFVWVTIPEKLIEWGLFCSDLQDCRAIPLPNYIWMCPTLFGGVSYIFLSFYLKRTDLHIVLLNHNRSWHIFHLSFLIQYLVKMIGLMIYTDSVSWIIKP